MEYNRRSVRNVSSCLQSTNIFNSEVGDRHLRENIPEGILQKVGKTKTTSCSIIAQLAPFEMVDEEEEEFQRCIRAMEYQLTWQSELLWPICQMEKPTAIQQKQPSNQNRMEGADEHSANAQRCPQNRKKSKQSLWQDQQFLQKLNDFIACDPSGDKAYFSTEDYFEK